MSKIAEYRQKLKERKDWTPFLLKNSGLPGPRGNLELAHTVAQQGNKKQFEQFLTVQAKENTPEVFLVFCGVLGLGKLAASEPKRFASLRAYASDPRWRIREAVATGLQLVGDQDMQLLIKEMGQWGQGNWYEKRAAAAALAEPRLLKEPHIVQRVLQILDQITASMQEADNPKEETFKVLRQAMGYCWSVAIAAHPQAGKREFEKLLPPASPHVLWIVKENLSKNRLARMDPAWVAACRRRIAAGTAYLGPSPKRSRP